MVNRYVPAERGETICPSCGLTIKVPPSPRRRRVQCPKCREVVYIDAASEKEPAAPEVPPRPVTSEPAITSEDRRRIEALEARVTALETRFRPPEVQGAADEPPRAKGKLEWVSAEKIAGGFSEEQSRALAHNLSTVGRQEIAIRLPAGSAVARERAEWFKVVFERAGWVVRGLEEVDANSVGMELSLAVPELPVAKHAAATYLALKAAGFEAIPVIDTALEGGDRCSMALTLPRSSAS